MKYYSNFKRWSYNSKTKKHHRLSIFGREKGNMLEVFILRCNPKDNLNKFVAKRVYAQYTEEIPGKLWLKEFHPEILEIGLETDSAKYVFDRFCDMYYKRGTISIETVPKITFDYLENTERMVILRKTLKFVKNGK